LRPADDANAVGTMTRRSRLVERRKVDVAEARWIDGHEVLLSS